MTTLKSRVGFGIQVDQRKACIAGPDNILSMMTLIFLRWFVPKGSLRSIDPEFVAYTVLNVMSRCRELSGCRVTKP